MGAAVPTSAPATPAAATGVPRGPVMMSPTAGGRAGLAHSRTRSSEAAAGGSRARDALDGHEQSAVVLVDDRARVVGDVPHETLGALEALARALAAQV